MPILRNHRDATEVRFHRLALCEPAAGPRAVCGRASAVVRCSLTSVRAEAAAVSASASRLAQGSMSAIGHRMARSLPVSARDLWEILAGDRSTQSQRRFTMVDDVSICYAAWNMRTRCRPRSGGPGRPRAGRPVRVKLFKRRQYKLGSTDGKRRWTVSE
jgi:hypothetical protein